MSSQRNKQIYPALYQAGFEKIEVAEIEQTFVVFSDSPKRRLLASHLRLFIGKLHSLEVKGELWVNGSFSTKNPNPMDIDLLLVISRSALANMTEENQKALGELTDISGREYVRMKWNCDLYVIESSDLGQRRYYEDLFSRNPDSFNKKGIPVITL